MGGQNQYIETGGFSEYLYEQVGKTVRMNGLTAKMIKLKTDKNGTHTGLPSFSNTSDVYLRMGQDSLACQAKAYESRTMIIDFDWSHEHINSGDGRMFKKGVVHVQKYEYLGKDKNGKVIYRRLSNEARLMNNAEMKKYGPILKKFNPKVKFR